MSSIIFSKKISFLWGKGSPTWPPLDKDQNPLKIFQ